MKPDSCVILCSAYPHSPTGTAYAVSSILPTVTGLFSRVDYVAVSAEKGTDRETGDWPGRVRFHHVPANAGAKWKRFLKSLFSPWPGTAQRYVSGDLVRQLRAVADGAGEKPVLVVLDAPLYWPLLADRDLRSRFSAVVLWCQNVNADVFAGIPGEVNLLASLSWRWEIARLRHFEERCLADADVVWAITGDDRDRFLESFGYEVDGVLGIRLEAGRFEREIGGSEDGLLYLGSFDIRKSLGISKFVRRVFPRLLEARPGLRLWLGGKGSEAFDAMGENVRGLGFVEDEEEFLGRGLLFVNPQESGSGIKLKSLHALAAGKVLLTTTVGVQGIPGVAGRDYLVGDGVEELAEAFLRATKEGADLCAIAANGRELARRLYGEEAFDRGARELFEAVLDTETREDEPAAT